MRGDDHRPAWTEITTVDELVDLLGEPNARARDKGRPALLDVDRDWLAATPFCVMATASATGECDASPKGDPAGQLVHVIDDRTIALAERPGNKRADGYKNILENPHVGLNFFIPGRGDTLRVNGRARLVRDAPFFDEMVVKGHRPLLAVVVEIDELFFHCAKAFLRSGLWKPETWDPDGVVPRRAVIAKEVEPSGMTLEQLDEYYEPENYDEGHCMPEYPFLKGHGTENDFVLLPDHDGSVHGDLSAHEMAERVRALCDRRAGIGGDGVLRVVRRGEHWFMDYRNADGSVSEMCGNGIRVFARHLVEEGLVDPAAPIPIDTRDGIKVLTVEGDLITADMGAPRVLGETKVGVGHFAWAATHVDMGNPHAVAFVDSLDPHGPVGPLLDPPDHDPATYPARRQRGVRRTARGAPRRDARARARLGGDPLLRYRRRCGDGRRPPWPTE